MNFKLLISLAILLLLGNPLLFALTKDIGTINGTLIDKETQRVIEFANVSIYRNNSKTPVKVVGSDANGSFIFDNIAPGEYRMEAILLGYVKHSSVIKIAANQSNNLGKIYLKADTKLLNSVEVTGIRSNMKLEIDKKVFSVDQTIAAAGASASDILKDIPSVAVDAEGTVSLRNSSSVTVWINGKSSGLTSENTGQVLEQMPAESIDRIEVITNPSSKFSPEGSAGIINIILKKDRKSGYYGSFRVGANYPLGANFGGNFNYSSSKVDIYANLGLRNESNDGGGYTKRQAYQTNEWTGLSDTSYLNTYTNRTFKRGGLFFRSGLDYHLNEKHTISLSGFAMDGGRQSDSEISYDFLDNSRLLTQKRIRKSNDKSGHGNYEISLNYLWEIGVEHNLQANLEYGERTHPSDNVYEQKNYDTDKIVTGKNYQKQSGPSSSKDWEFKLDYTNKISEKWKIEAGLNSEMSKTWSENKIMNGIETGDLWTMPSIPNVANGFDSNEQIHAVYGTLTGKMTSNFGYQLGLRGEYTKMDFVSTDLNTHIGSTNRKEYFDLFPTLFLNYSLTKTSDIQLNYSKRINRPHGHSLNPFVNITDSANIQIGNPNLNPEYANAFEMNYIKTWDNHTFTSSLYHRITNGVIQNIRYMNNGNMYQSPSNVTKSSSSGLEVVSKNKLSKMVETTTTLNFYKEQMDGFNYRSIHYNGTNGFSWNARLNGTLLFTKDLSGQISGFYSAPRIIAQGKSKSSYSLDIGLRRSFLDRKIQISVNGQNLLNSFKFENYSRGQGFYQETSNQFFGRSIRLNLTWNFGNLKPKEKSGKENMNENPMDAGGDL